MASWLGQYCINVTDLDRSVAFYELLGLTCTSRTEIPHAFEAIVEHPDGGSQLQLAQQKEPTGPIDRGTAFWKLYVNTHDIAALHQRAVDAGHTSTMAPERLERWPVTIGFLADPDGYPVELVQRDPWPDDAPVGSWLGQCCINVSDLDAAVARYEALGLTCTSRTDIDEALEAIVEAPGQGGKLQLAQQKGADGPIDPGNALWKLYVHTDDIEALHATALGNGLTETMAPLRLEQWPVTVSFVTDPDGYLIELVQRD